MSRSSRIGPVSGGGTTPPPAPETSEASKSSPWRQVGIIGIAGIFLLLIARIFGTFGWENWLSFAILLGVVYAAIQVLTRPGAPYAASKNTLEMVFRGVVLIFFVLSPLWGWQHGTVELPFPTKPASASKTFIVSMAANSDSQRFSVGAGETPHYIGEKSLEIRWQCTSGRISKESDPKGSWCQGAIAAYWMHDLSGSSNSATITIR